MAEITPVLAVNTRCLVENFRLICYSQGVNGMWQYKNSGSSSVSKWPNNRMAAAVKHCWLVVQGRRDCRER